jgi:pimeloyl-ACP methyl ester carboxylesterase
LWSVFEIHVVYARRSLKGEAADSVEAMRVGDVEFQVQRLGAGTPALFLHGEDALLFAGPFLEQLGERFEVVAPLHPGWGPSRPSHVRTLDDLAYLYLDLIGQLERPAVVIGASIGAWLAAEIATKNQTNIAALVLVAPVGIKTGGRDERAFVDVWATEPGALRNALYADPANAPNLADLAEEDFLTLAIAQEAVTRFAWEPYMHNPQLRSRLHRITVPTLVVGGSRDRFVLEEDYCSAFAAAIGANAESKVLEAGHRVEEEAPQLLRDAIAEFADSQMPVGAQGDARV